MKRSALPSVCGRYGRVFSTVICCSAQAGISVSTGARIAALAGPSQVLVSQTVKELVAGSGFTFTDAGEHQLKGIPQRYHLYAVS